MYPDDEEGFWMAECLSLPGCVAQGETREEALENIRVAIMQYMEALQARDIPIPADTHEAFIVAVD